MKSSAVRIRAALRSLEEKLSQGDISASETILLAYLHEHGEALPSELAEELSLSRGRLSHLLRRAEKRGWIQSAELQRDRRSKRIELSPDGRQAGEEAAARVASLEENVLLQLGSAEEALLRQMLLDIQKIQ